MNALELVEPVVAQLTGRPSNVKVHEDEYGVILEIFSPDNNAVLVGKRKDTIEAIRVLARALGYNGKHKIKVILRERTKEVRHPN